MKLEVTVSEIADIFKEIQQRPGQLFEMIRLDIKEVCGGTQKLDNVTTSKSA